MPESEPSTFENWKFREYGKDCRGGILADYVKEDDYIDFHRDDPDLAPIRIYLPVSPDWRLIEGFGLPAKDQYFKAPKVPARLDAMSKELLRKRQASGDEDEFLALREMWKFLLDNQVDYRVEIEWLRKLWYYRKYGYWCFINGKPTFVDGYHLTYYMFRTLEDVPQAQYRDRDRRYFLALRYFHKTTEAPFGVKATWFEDTTMKSKYFGLEQEADEHHSMLEQECEAREVKLRGWVLEYGDFVVDVGYRTCLGVNYPKHRREGATSKTTWWMLMELSDKMNRLGGIISMDKTHSASTFSLHIMAPFRDDFPWYFKPEFPYSDGEVAKLLWRKKSKQVGASGAGAFGAGGLNTQLDYSTTGDSKFYDQRKLHVLYEDECGKTIQRDVYAGHDQTKHCLTQGSGSTMVGFTIKTSTVGEMSKKGGAGFYKLCEASKFNERNATGLTQTFLITLFIPSWDGLEGFIGPYGESIIGNPTPEQMQYIGRDYGAKRHLFIQEQQLRRSKSKDAMNLLNEHFRLHPTRYRDCFRSNTSDVGFNVAILADRINELQFAPTATEPGRFVWNDEDQRVYWERDKTGPCFNSLVLKEEESNRFFKDGQGNFVPREKNRFIHSGDPVKFMKTQHNRKSDAAGASFMLRDYIIDDTTVSVDQWMSHRFIWDYRDRPMDVNEASEQLVLSNLYYGGLCGPEINVPRIWDYYHNNGYDEFLYYFQNHATGDKKKTPGFNSQTGSKDSIFACWANYIESHGMRERHIRLLRDVSEIEGVEHMPDYDSFVAGGGCLLIEENINPPQQGEKKSAPPPTDEGDFLDLGDLYGDI